MGRLIAISTVCLGLTGCTVMSAVSAVQGSVVETIAYLFQGTDISLPKDTASVLAAAQQGLRKLSLDVDVLEPVDGGYEILLGNDRLNGQMKIRAETRALTTISVRVREGMSRHTAIEKAVVGAVREQSANPEVQKEFNTNGYLPVYTAMKAGSKQVGWYRRGGWVEVTKVGEKNWLQLKLPSGKNGYLRQIKDDLSITKAASATSVKPARVSQKGQAWSKPPSRKKRYTRPSEAGVSILKDVPAALADVQLGLRTLSLDVDVLEPVDGGYDILFGNEKLDGYMKIRAETRSLTAVFVRARKGSGIRAATKKALIDAVRNQSRNSGVRKKFNMNGYMPLYKAMRKESQQVGWYRRGAWVKFSKAGRSGWLRLYLPSGQKGYLHKPEVLKAGK